MEYNTYKDACLAFHKNKITYEQLRDLLYALPFPDKKRPPKSVADVYYLADMPEPPNSIWWVGTLQGEVARWGYKGLSNDQLVDLCHAAYGVDEYEDKEAPLGKVYPLD